ncbi:hypothetical protein WOLCODRAFT_140781, partial [Wolfiporia cocos MD-104 SS10]
MITMLDVTVEGGYSIMKPDLMYNTNHDRDSQRWTWSIVPGEVKKKLPVVWEYSEDLRIDLDRLQQRYLEQHYIDPEKVGGKRKRDSKNDSELSKSRKRTRYTTSCADLKDWEVEVSHIEGTAPEELCHDDAQMLKYINEHMSHNVRSFGSGIMVREMTIQLWYADWMGIIISEPFHIVEQSELLLFAVAALGHADLHRLGICHLMRFDGRNVCDVKGEEINERLKFDVTAIGEDDIYTEFRIIGRGTTVVPIRAKGHAATLFGDAELVAKIAWPVNRTNRVETTTTMTIRTTLAAKKSTMLDHILGLPRAYMGTRVLDERMFRTIIMQRYAPLELMNSAAEFKSIFLDVIRSTKSSGSSKRSQSPTVPAQTVPAPAPERASIARKFITEALGTKGAEPPAKQEPVKQEFPNADAQPETTPRRPKPLRYRTGTGPFMAIDLLTRGRRPLHRYHHDLESFFFLLAYMCAVFDVTRHKFDHIPEWECADLEQIGERKLMFVSNDQVFGDMFHTQTNSGFKQLVTEWVSPLSDLFCEVVVVSMKIRKHRQQLAKLDASIRKLGRYDFLRLAPIYSKMRKLQNDIRKFS